MTRAISLIAAIIAIGASLLLFAYCCPFVLSASDTGWLLRTGQYILQTGALPSTDVFSWTSRNSWVLYQWLFEVAAGALFSAGGLWLVGAVFYMVEGIVFLFVLPQQWLRKGIPLSITFLALACNMTPPWFYVRPQLASGLLTIVFLFVLERCRLNKEFKWLWLLPPLMVLWVNTHSLWFLGLLYILAYLIKDLRHKQLAMVLVACSLAVFINPYGIGIISYNLTFLTEPDFKNIGELHSLFQLNEPLLYLFLGYLVVGWIFLLKYKHAVPVAGFIISAGTAIAAVLFARFCPIATVATWPFFGLALSQHQWKFHENFNVSKWSFFHLIFAALAPLLIWRARVPSDMIAAEIFMNNDVESMLFLQKHHTADLWLNDPATGSHMILFGIGPVFIDNRFDMYGVEFCRRWQDAVDGKIDWATLVQHNPRVAQAAFRRGSGLERSFSKDQRWMLVYDDGALTYWLTDTPQHRALVELWRAKR